MKKKMAILAIGAAMMLSACGNNSASHVEEQSKTDITATESAKTDEKKEAEEKADEQKEVAEEAEGTATENAVNEETEEKAEESVAPGEIVSMTSVDDTWKFIHAYGYEDDGRSKLSMSFVGDTLQETDDYYEQKVLIYKNVTIPTDIAVGNTYTLLREDNLDKNKEVTVTKVNDLTYQTTEGDEYYTFEATGTEQTLYETSDDAVQVLIANGVVRIKKDALHGVDITKEYRALDPEQDLKSADYPYTWYNGIYFGDDGMITKVVFFGD